MPAFVINAYITLSTVVHALLLKGFLMAKLKDALVSDWLLYSKKTVALECCLT